MESTLLGVAREIPDLSQAGSVSISESFVADGFFSSVPQYGACQLIHRLGRAEMI
jgi:hypothetical protein